MNPVIEQIEEVVGEYKIVAYKDEFGCAGFISGKNYFMSMPEANDGSKFTSVRQVINQSKIFLGFHELNKIKN